MAANDIQIRVGSSDNATPSVEALQARIQAFGKQKVSAKIGVDDKAGQYQLALINAKIAETSKKVANPKIDVVGVAKAEAQIAGLELQMSKLGDKSGGQAGQSFAKGFLNFVLPGKKTSIVTAGGLALAGLPALAGVQGIAMGSELVLHLTSSILSANKQVKQAFKGIGDSIMGSLETAIKPLVPVIIGAGKQFSGFIKQIQPELNGLFKSIAPIIQPVLKAVEGVGSQLIGVMKAVVPAMQPFITGLLGLVKNLLPGLSSIIKSTVPFIGQFGKMLGGIGSALGDAFKSFGAVIKPSMAVLGDLLKVVSGLLPVVADLAGVFAKALSPVLKDLGGIFASLEPAIRTVGKVLASFAGAVLTSLSGALKAVGELLKGVAPSFNILAKALGQVFNLLQNTGVFGVLEDSLEKIARPLANLINALIKGLVPVLPQIIQLITQFSNILITLLSDGLVAVLNIVTKVLTKFPALVPITLAVVGAIKAWAVAQGLLNVVMDANPIGLVITAIGALVIGIVELVKHWSAVKDAFVTAWNAVLEFIKKWWPLLLGAVTGGIGLVVAVIVKYHAQILNAIKAAWNAVFNAVKNVWNEILNFAKQWWPLLLGPGGLILKYHTQIENAIKAAWNAIKSFLSNIWNGISSAAKSAFNALTSVVKNAFNEELSGIKIIWNAIMSFLRNVWGNMKSGFQDAVNGVKSAWNKLEGIFKSPISFLINTVYDNGIARLWNDVMSKIGGPTLPIIKGFAAGGKLPGYGGGDRNLALLEDGETVVPKHLTPKFAPMFKAAGIPGFSGGGLIGEAAAIGKMMVAGATGNETAFSNAFSSAVSPIFGGGGAKADLLKMAIGIPTTMIKDVVSATWNKIKDLFGGGPTAQAIVKYAESFVGKVPYLWGGTTPNGWDCSGFSSYVYKHAGYTSVPRTSQQQAVWVQRSPAPQMGGLAFYTGSDGTSSAPGHVGILTGHGNQIVDALGTGLGTRIDNLGTPLWTGIPPSGFKGNPPMGHSAGGAVAAGLAMVGERGRELVRLPGGASVMNNGATERMLSGASQPVCVHLEFTGSGSGDDLIEPLFKLLRKGIRVKGGGNVQAVLGH